MIAVLRVSLMKEVALNTYSWNEEKRRTWLGQDGEQGQQGWKQQKQPKRWAGSRRGDLPDGAASVRVNAIRCIPDTLILLPAPCPGCWVPDNTASLILTFSLLYRASEAARGGWSELIFFQLHILKIKSIPVLCLCFPPLQLREETQAHFQAWLRCLVKRRKKKKM